MKAKNPVLTICLELAFGLPLVALGILGAMGILALAYRWFWVWG